MSRPSLTALATAATITMTGAAVAAIATAAAASGAAMLVFRSLRNRRIWSQRAHQSSLRPVVVITGGSRGLGLAIATRFAEDPVRLVLAARHLEELQQAQVQLLTQFAHLSTADFHLVAADLAKPEECERLVAETIARFGRIDVLVNNAAIIHIGPVESQTLEIFERTMRVNFFAALYVTWAALPHMRRQPALAGHPFGSRRASIVNIASVGGKIPVPHMLPYSVAKFALVGFSEGLHAELRHKGIRVTTVCPGLMRTGGEAHANFLGNQNAEQRWFNFAARTPGVAVTMRHAANRIYRAAVAGRAEITISPQAWLAARFGALCPEFLQYANALTNHHVLPKDPHQ